MKTKFVQAMKCEIDYGSDYNNINKAILKARKIPIIDLVDMSGKTMGEVAEILAILKNCNQIELIYEGFEA